MKGLALAAILLAAGCSAPRESYRWYYDPDVLNDPVRVRVVIRDDMLELEDGRLIRLPEKVDGLEKWIEGSGREVEVVPQSTGADGVIQAEVFVRRHVIVHEPGDSPSDVWIRTPFRPR